jgi:hypothetical protein
MKENDSLQLECSVFASFAMQCKPQSGRNTILRRYDICEIARRTSKELKTKS